MTPEPIDLTPEQDGLSEPDWQSADHIDLTAPGPVIQRPRRSPPLRWCLTAAGLAAIGVLAAGALYVRQSRTIVSTRVVSSPGQATADLTGCPVGAGCSWSQLPDGGPLFHAVQHLLPTTTVVQAESVYDNGTAREYLVRLVAETPDGIQLTVTATRDPTGRPTPGWQSPIPGQGPADIALVVPGHRAGTAVAVSAVVPPGVRVPAVALRQLAADPSLQLAP